MARTAKAYVARVRRRLEEDDEPTEYDFPEPRNVKEALLLAEMYGPGEWGHEEVDAIIAAMTILAAEVKKVATAA